MLRAGRVADATIINQREKENDITRALTVYIIYRINILPSDASGRKAQYGPVR